MIRRQRTWAITVGLAASLLSGCLSDRSHLRKDEPGNTVLPARGEVSGLQGPPPRSTYDQRNPAGKDRTPTDLQQTAGPAAPPDTPTEPPPPPGAPLLPPQLQPPPPASSEPQPIQQVSVTPTRQEEPLLASLRAFQEQKPAQALELLHRYDPATRELLALLLPLAARLSEIRFDKARANEMAAHLKGIDALIEGLRPKAALTIDKGCFCRRIKTFGEYEPLPEGHLFRYGDPVQVYLELRNLTTRRNGPHYETILTKTVRIYESQHLVAGGKQRPDVLWQLPMQINQSRIARHDWFVNCSFYVPPNLPVGAYTLEILIQDVTELPRGAKVPAERTARRRFTFHVDPRGTGLVSAAEQIPR